MASSSSNYRKAYETAKRELTELIATQEKLEKRKVELRRTIEVLASLCEDQKIAFEPSPEASYLLKHSSIADEIRSILKSKFPGWQRPHQLKAELQSLGHDLSKYKNPQATIHMVLKRLVQSKEVDERVEDGKQVYRYPDLVSLATMGATKKK